MKKMNLTLVEEMELKGLHQTLKDGKKRDRIKTILFLNKGFSYEETAELLLLNEKTIRKIEKGYVEDGKEKFLDDNYVCYNGKLTDEQKKEVSDYVENNMVMDALYVVNYIRDNFDIIYTRQGVNRLLHRLGFVHKKTKKIPSKASLEAQEKHIEEYKELKAKLTEKEKIYFMDGVHPMHNIENQYCWIKKGEEKEVKANTGRNRININGAYNIEEQEAIIIESDTINAQSTIELYEKIEKMNPELETIYVVRDNARYYGNKLVKEYLETSRIKEICLPTYSPNLNPIERLWLFFKRKITYNQYYEKFSDFKKIVMDFFNNGLLGYKNELKTFITDNFRAIGY